MLCIQTKVNLECTSFSKKSKDRVMEMGLTISTRLRLNQR